MKPIPTGWTDESEMFFNPGDGFAYRKKNGITATIRSKYIGDDASLELVEFKDGEFCLFLQSPRGFGRNKIQLREIVNQHGEKNYSKDFDRLVEIAEAAIEAGSNV